MSDSDDRSVTVMQIEGMNNAVKKFVYLPALGLCVLTIYCKRLVGRLRQEVRSE